MAFIYDTSFGASDRFLFFIQQVPTSGEPGDSPVNAIPKTEDGLIDWSKVSTQY